MLKNILRQWLLSGVGEQDAALRDKLLDRLNDNNRRICDRVTILESRLGLLLGWLKLEIVREVDKGDGQITDREALIKKTHRPLVGYRRPNQGWY